MKISARIVGIAGIERKLDAVPGALRAGMQAGALMVKGLVDRAPRVRRGPMRWKTRKQRFWFLMALKEGKIEFPYFRSQNPLSEGLSKRWTMSSEDDGLRWVLGNNTSYGPYVQDQELQSVYHEQTGWKTVQAIEEQARPRVTQLVSQEIRRILGG